MKRNNHFVSQFYLKNWADDEGKIWCYRTLVAHENVPNLKRQSIGGIGFHRNLYIRLLAGDESDDMETMFDTKFESPAQQALQKLISNERRLHRDWKKIIRFLAMQDVRTPKRLLEHLQRGGDEMSELIQGVLNDVKGKLESGQIPVERTEFSANANSMNLPMRIVKKASDDADYIQLGVETVVGRGSWLYGIEHLLKYTIHHLYGHNWQVLHPADGYVWPVSDTPVIKLNYYDTNKYDFKGGWANKGSEIIMPVGPQHLIYTQIGNNKSLRPNKLDADMTEQFIKLIFESAHRMVFMSREEPSYLKYRPRVVSQQKLQDEQMEWKLFHERQVEAERQLHK